MYRSGSSRCPAALWAPEPGKEDRVVPLTGGSLLQGRRSEGRSYRRLLGRHLVGSVALVRHSEEEADHEGGEDREGAIDENGGHDLGLAAAEADERGGE